MPESIESRMGSVERDMAGIKQRVDDLAGDVKVVPALMESMAELKVAMQYMQRDQGDVKTALERLNSHMEQREQTRHQGESVRRWQGYAMGAGLFSVLLAIVAQIIITLATGGPG